MIASRLHWISLLLLIGLVWAPASARARKAPAPPSDFDERAMTGSSGLEARVVQGMDLERLGPDELEALKTVALQEGQTRELSGYIAALLGRDQLQEAIDVLHQRAWSDFESESKLADVLDLAMGQLRWGACAQLALSRLERRMIPALFLVRALCLQRSGDPEGAIENVEAAATLADFDPVFVQQLRAQLAERGGGQPPPPADDAVYAPFQQLGTSGGPLDQLFVFQLMGRKDPGWLYGTLDWGGFGASELREVILSRSRAYRYCHAAAKHGAKRPNKPLSGSVTVVWRIDALGRVKDPTLVEPSWGGHPRGDWLNACLVDQVGKLRFPQPVYGLPMPARHRFSFAD